MEFRDDVCQECSHENHWEDEINSILKERDKYWQLDLGNKEEIYSDYREFWLDRNVVCFISEDGLAICKKHLQQIIGSFPDMLT